MTSPEQSLILFLRITAVILLSAAFAVVMPYSWMYAAHEWLGLGTLPDQPLVGYLNRSLSALYASIGACYWFLSNDLRRYLPLLRFSIPVKMVFCATLFVIDLTVAMPIVWTAVEATFLLTWMLLLWWLVRHCETRASI